jgi:ubiquinone/menaquinone biosynthesis C-methylase UbiE
LKTRLVSTDGNKAQGGTIAIIWSRDHSPVAQGTGKVNGNGYTANVHRNCDQESSSGKSKNVQVVQGDALHTRLAAESMDAALIFGVIPAPMVPMEQLLSEMRRILKLGGNDGSLATELGAPEYYSIRII